MDEGLGFALIIPVFFLLIPISISSIFLYIILRDKKGFRCKKSEHFTKPVKNITTGIFICYKQVNNDTKSNSYSLK